MPFKSIVKRPSFVGIATGIALMALSFTPSLIPRDWTIQAVIAGLTFVGGYGIGVGLNALWRYLGLPIIPHKHQRTATLAALAASSLILMYCLFRTLEWQNEVRQIVSLDPIDSAYPIRTVLLALAVIVILLLFFRFLWWLIEATAGWIGGIIPRSRWQGNWCDHWHSAGYLARQWRAYRLDL